MKAMVLAAGLGTRLRPLTDDRPKALATIGGQTLLEIALRRLRTFGIHEVIVNLHHFAEMVAEYLREHGNFGMHIELSREEILLDTGGGLLKAADFFLRDGADEPFVLHNVDVLSSIDLAQMAEFHRKQNALATLAVQRRTSSRYLLLDAGMQLCGRQVAGAAEAEMARARAATEEWAFAGIHVLSPRVFELMRSKWVCGGSHAAGASASDPVSSPPVFSIVAEYLRLAAAGEKILGYDADGCYWRDLGTLSSLDQAAADASRGLVAL
jgi:NDP-sugar pyrophosphorylase family protein